MLTCLKTGPREPHTAETWQKDLTVPTAESVCIWSYVNTTREEFIHIYIDTHKQRQMLLLKEVEVAVELMLPGPGICSALTNLGLEEPVTV